MPKTKVAPRPPDNVPLWDALVAELGDPRPYEPTVISASFVVPVDAFTDVLCVVDDALAQLDRDADDALSDLDDHEESGLQRFYAGEDALRARLGLPERTIPEPPYDDVLRDMLDQTVVMPVLTGERTVQLEKDAIRWPS